jgi:sulfoxide reductase heme-binding subunit YedZ
MTRRTLRLVKLFVWLACLAPAAILALRAFNVGSLSLGANPVEELLNVCGKTGLNLLMITLMVTPVRRATGLNWLIRLRRLLGLFAFFYLVMHFSTYLALDLGFAWSTVLVDIAERPYITVGFTALMLLVPLAVTSTTGWQRRLGPKWFKLHRLVYVIAVLAVVHYWWQVKLDIADPAWYALLLSILFGVRLKHWLDFRRKRRELVDAKPAMATAYHGVEPPQSGDKARHQRNT